MVAWHGLPVQWQFAAQKLTQNRLPDADITVQAGDHLRVVGDGLHGEITYASVADLMRGINLWFGSAQHEVHFDYQAQASFKQFAAMVDLARNGALTIAALKQLIVRLAGLGYTELWLYLEDEFEIPGQPYFGASRGRYSQDELHEVALYGDTFGVKVVPAIQTLAHLRNPLKWETYADIRDTADNLFVGKPETASFIKALLAAATAPFTTNKIHIGMDEAHELGRGQMLTDQGFQSVATLMQQHLQMVLQACEQLALEPLMWSDMWFEAASPQGGLYDAAAEFSPELRASVPAIPQVYWDYYHEDVDFYAQMLAKHFEFAQDVQLALGGSTWNGLAPMQTKMRQTIAAGMTAARQQKLSGVSLTLWFDDGSETPFAASYLALQVAAEYQYHATVSDADLATRFADLQGENLAAYMLLDQFDQLTATPNLTGENPSKIILYEDLLLQRYRDNLADFDAENHYQSLAGTLQSQAFQQPYLKAFYVQLAQVLTLKARVLRQLQQLKTNHDADGVQANLDALLAALDGLAIVWRKLWHLERRGPGFEVIDVRLGGLIQRAKTVSWRISQWQAGLDSLSELDTHVPMDRHTSGPIGHGLYQEIVSASDLSH